jgi:hypothetical protein
VKVVVLMVVMEVVVIEMSQSSLFLLIPVSRFSLFSHPLQLAPWCYSGGTVVLQ